MNPLGICVLCVLCTMLINIFVTLCFVPQETDDPSAVLWYEEIQNTVDVANQQASEGEKSECMRFDLR